MLFQYTSVRENVFNSHENRYGRINSFRNGNITQHSTSVDIGKILRSSGYTVDILEGFLFNRLEYNLFERFFW